MNANGDFAIVDCVCKTNYYADRLKTVISENETGPEYDWLRAHNFTFRTWDCTECPDGAVCDGTTDGKGNVGQPSLLPINCTDICSDDSAISTEDGQQGSRLCCSSKVWLPAAPYAEPNFWSLSRPQFRTQMFECEEGFCEGGAMNLDGESVCSTANSGSMYVRTKLG